MKWHRFFAAAQGEALGMAVPSEAAHWHFGPTRSDCDRFALQKAQSGCAAARDFVNGVSHLCNQLKDSLQFPALLLGVRVSN